MTGCEYLTHGNLCSKKIPCKDKSKFKNYVTIDNDIVYGICEDVGVL